MKALIFDTETTGLHEPQVIEAAWMRVTSLAPLRTEGTYCQRFRPTTPIEFGAMATHHITDDDLEHCPPSADFRLPDDVQYLVGHNIDFDWNVIGRPAIRRIDTLALCRALWPETDSHKQTAMLYMLNPRFARQYAADAHSAAADVFMLARLLTHILDRLGNPATLDELWQHSEAARVPRTMPFGKHKGELIADVPVDYRRWLAGQGDLDPYLRCALEQAALA